MRSDTSARMTRLAHAMLVAAAASALLLAPAADAQQITVLSGLTVSFTNDGTTLTGTMTVTTNNAGSVGWSSSGMAGPIVACYMSSSVAASCPLYTAYNYGVSATGGSATIVSSSLSGGGWTITWSAPLSYFGAQPGTSQRVILAYLPWNGGALSKHANNARTSTSFTLNVATTTAAPATTTTTTAAPTTTTAAPTTTTSAPTTVSVGPTPPPGPTTTLAPGATTSTTTTGPDTTTTAAPGATTTAAPGSTTTAAPGATTTTLAPGQTTTAAPVTATTTKAPSSASAVAVPLLCVVLSVLLQVVLAA